MNKYWQTLSAGLTAVVFLSLLLWHSPPLDEYSPDCLLWQSGEASGIQASEIGFSDATPLSQDKARTLNQSRHQYSVFAPASWKEHAWNIDYESWLKYPCINTYWSVRDRGEPRVYVRFQDGPPGKRVSAEPEFWLAEGIVLDTSNKAIVSLVIREYSSGQFKSIYSE